MGKTQIQNWEQRRISEVIQKIPITGKKLPQSKYQPKGKFPVIDQGSKFVGGYSDENIVVPCELPVIIFGDHTKSIKFVDFPFIAGADGIKVIKPSSDFIPKLFYYFLQSIELPNKGYARHFQYLEKATIPVPPFPEQEQIVARIEELFTQLDAGTAALKRAQAGLRRYKASVLKAAFEGRLVPQDPNDESVSNLYQKEGNLSPSVNPIFPPSWGWVAVNQIGTIVTGRTPSKNRPDFFGHDFPFFKPTDLNAGYETHYSQDGLSFLGMEEANKVPAKSVLVTCIGATIGKTGLIHVAGASNQQINSIIPNKEIMPEYLYFICISPQFQKSIRDNASATTLPIINKSRFGELFLPLPPLKEQFRIVEKLDQVFSLVKNMDYQISQNLKRMEHLRQSILKHAFEGKLV